MSKSYKLWLLLFSVVVFDFGAFQAASRFRVEDAVMVKDRDISRVADVMTFRDIPVLRSDVKKEAAPFKISFTTLFKDSIISFPKDNQLYARDSNNRATIKIQGIADAEVDSLIVKVHGDKGVVTRSVFGADGAFSIPIEIEALKHNYTIELIQKTKEREVLLKSAKNITAGDVYVLSGQSNAWAIDYDNVYNDTDLPSDAQWVRTIGAMHVYNKSAIYPEVTNADWYQASGKAPDIRGGLQLVGNGMVGVLGMNIGINLVASENVPIAIINGAGGGGAISFYQKTKDSDLDSSYGRLQYRLAASGLKNHIKAFIWNQGENNADDSVDDYKKALNQLYDDFKSDYTFEKFYIIQTPPGCNSKMGHQTVREAQRQFYEAHKDVKILTRHGFPKNPKRSDGNYFLSDGCHYHAHGYKVLASWIANLARYDFYGSALDYEAPQLVGIKLASSKSLIIEFDKPIAIQPDRKINGISYALKDYGFAINTDKITEVSKLVVDPKNPKTLQLKFKNQQLSKGDILHYILEDNYPETSFPYSGPWLIDAYTGVGVVGFSKAVQ